MSRGLGMMQRAILHIYDVSLVTPPLHGWHQPPRWLRGGREDWRDYAWLREEVARLRGAWCETDCWGEGPRLASHKPHFAYGGGFEVAFARAVRTLLTRGVLVARTDVWQDAPCPVGPAQRIAYVARAKCSEQY